MKLALSLNNSETSAPFSVLNLRPGNRMTNIIPEEKRNITGNVLVKNFSDPKYTVLQLDTRTQSRNEIICDFDGSAFVMSFMKKGCMKCIADSIKNTLKEKQNNIFYIRGNTRCQLQKADCFYIVLSETYMTNLFRLYPETMNSLSIAMKTGKFFVFDHSHLYTTLEMERVIKEIENLDTLESGKEMFLDAKIKELLCMQINHHIKTKRKHNPTLEKYREQMEQVCAFMEKNIQKEITLQEISKHVGVCETILKIAFKHFYEKTVFTYLNECRLQKACHLLHHTSHSISEVALMSGYENPSYFSTIFKQKCGITPLEYRKSG